MKNFGRLFLFQVKILLSSWPKIAIALGSAVCIPILFPADSAAKALYQMDLYLTVPAAVLMAELFQLEYTHRTAEILFGTRRRKTVLFLQRFGVLFLLLALTGGVVFGEYCLLYEALGWDPDRTVPYVLTGLAGICGTMFFFGALSVTVTDLTRNYFAGIGAALALFLLFYYLPFFQTDAVTSLFTLYRIPDWGKSKLFYAVLALLLLAVNDRCIHKSPVR